ncbi:MAG: PorT family protein [Bacteroidetes bacterium]|nr:PorT family protein [Bacteroidota bacterium]
MKKIAIILLAVLFTASYAQAQFRAGIRAGLNVTSFWGSAVPSPVFVEESNTEGRFGFQAGVVGEYAFGKRFAVQPAIIYAQQGYMVRETIGDEEEYLMDFALNYVQVPINLMVKLGSPKICFFLQAGPYVGYALNGKGKIEHKEGTKVIESQKDDVNFTDDSLKRLDMGAGIGLGMQFSSVQVAFGYNIGLMNISNNSETNMKNNGASLTLTYLFGKVK